MKSLLRNLLFHLLALYLSTIIFRGSFTLNPDIKFYLLAGGVLTLLNLILKPVLKLLFLPLTALTLGLFSVIINAGVFYLFLKLFPEISVTAWNFAGFNLSGFTIPPFQLNFFLTLTLIAMFISLITHLLTFLVK